MNRREKIRLFAPCYYSFFANGAMVLLIGAILPYIMEEAQISYSVAGSALSIFAIGNLVASFINPILVKYLGRKITIMITSIWIPICFIALVFVPPVPVMFFCFLCVA